MAEFGSLDPNDWREQEAQEGLKLQQADAAAAEAKKRTWADTGRSILNAPYTLAKSIGSMANAPPSEEADQAAMMPETFANPLVKGLGTAVGGAIKSGALAPGDALANKIPEYDPTTGHTSPQMIQRGFDTAALAGGASVAGTTDALPKLAADSAKAAAPIAAAEHAPPFYSALEKAVAEHPKEVAPASEWTGVLANKGVKADELKYTGGLGDKLAAQGDQPVTKAELQDHLEQNKVQLGEVTRGEMPKWENLPPKMQYDLADRWEMKPDTAREHYDDMVASGEDMGFPNAARYAGYQLPGGTNYREKLLTLPTSQKTVEELARETYDNFGRTGDGPVWEKLDPRTQADYLERAQANIGDHGTKPAYQSSHWDEPNVLAHLRMNDRTMQEPGYVLQNMKSGNKSPVFQTLREANDYAAKLPEGVYPHTQLTDAQVPKKSLHLEEIQSDWHQEGRQQGYSTPESLADLGRRSDAGEDVSNVSMGVPDAPFKKNWHELALKRALHEAAEGGYDRMSWTPGAQQASNPKVLNGSRPMVGDAAARAERADKGLQGFYDKIVPDYLNKVGKPHGAEVKQGAIGARLVDNQGKPAMSFGSQAEAEQWLKKNDPNNISWHAEPINAHYMDITPSLKQHLLTKGMPLFEDSSPGAAVAAAEHVPAPRDYGPLGVNPKEEALTVNDILHPDTPALPTGSRNVEDIAQQLMDRGSKALRKLGVKSGRIEEAAPHTDELLSRGIASEIKGALGRGGSAEDWYTKKIQEAMDTASQLHPELKNDPHQKMGFTSALAVTSQGETVLSNVRLANAAYEQFKQTGHFPTDVQAKHGAAMNANFAKLNGLIDTLGPDGAREFLHKQFTVKDLENAGFDVGGENKQTKVFGSAILGPKIGQGFYQNLNGNYNPVTMDLWFMRAWGRMTGTLVGKTDVTKPTARLVDAMRAEGMRVPRDPEKLSQAADDIVLKHERDFRANRDQYDSGKKAKSELTFAAERYQKNTKGINEQPTSGSQRQWMRDRVDRAREILAQNGHKVTNADLQAIWWYPEKELYSKLGGRDSERINVDYATAFKDLLARKGAPNAEAPAAAAVRPMERGPRSPAPANVASPSQASSRGRQKANGPVASAGGPPVPFGSLNPSDDQ
jgi:hypothetical protein